MWSRLLPQSDFFLVVCITLSMTFIYWHLKSFQYAYTSSLRRGTAPACSPDCALEWGKNLWLRSKIGRGHGTPVEAQAVMTARYLLNIMISDHSPSKFAVLGSMSYSPSHDRRHDSETTSDFKKIPRKLYTLWTGVIAKPVVGYRNEAEEDDQSKEHDYEWYIGAESSQQENEADQGHDESVVALGGIPWLARNPFWSKCLEDKVGWIAGVRQDEPMATIDDEYGEGEGISQNKLGKTGDIHGDAAHEIQRAADAHQRGQIRAFELEETPHGDLKWDKEADETEQGWVG
jgi:hypothetical protein